jgi:hypothetical protein
MTTQESDDHALMVRLGVTEDDFNEAMGPVGEQIRLMAQDQGRDVEEFFLSPSTTNCSPPWPSATWTPSAPGTPAPSSREPPPAGPRTRWSASTAPT